MLRITYIFLFFISFSSPFNVFATEHNFHHPEAALQAIAKDKRPGEKIYQSYCANCHALKPMIPVGAPRIGVKAEWQPRLKKGMKTLFKNAALGINNMPARGGCFECSDELLQAAIDYMLPKKKDPA